MLQFAKYCNSVCGTGEALAFLPYFWIFIQLSLKTHNHGTRNFKYGMARRFLLSITNASVFCKKLKVYEILQISCDDFCPTATYKNCHDFLPL